MIRTEFIAACKGIETPFIPVWFMRQAGRYLPGYRRTRQRHSFMEILKTPDLITEITLEPLHLLNVDAVIIFSDILILPNLMGMDLDYLEEKGPVFKDPLRMKEDVSRLRQWNEEEAEFLGVAIRMVQKDAGVPVIGFAGAPFTTALYMIEGSHNERFLNAFRLIYSNPDLFKTIIDLLTDNTVKYLLFQIKHGVSVIQIFDSHAGFLSKDDYLRFSLPYIKRIVSEIKSVHPDMPIIFFSVGTSAYLKDIIGELKVDVYNPDWTMDMAELDLPERSYALQGNLNPLIFFANMKEITSRVRWIVDRVRRKGYIFNTGHGLNPLTDYVKVREVVSYVHQL
jgi:uroporphyrinogen decarboxylase